MTENKFDQVKALIEAFLELYPEAENGFAHVVLSDYNLDDGFIRRALHRYGDIRNPTQTEFATYTFLGLLDIIPEAERIVPDEDDDD